MNADDRALGLGNVDAPEPERTGHVRLPVGTVEQCHRAEALEKHPPRVVAELDGDTGRQGDKHGRDGVAPVIEQLAQRRGRVGPARLLAIDRVQALVDEQADAAQGRRPSRGFLTAGGAVAVGDKHNAKWHITG
uniref:Uncharacterized protein n=1 Tax=Anopheles merus TaxID=30066 RepID=A0A182VFR7_ANOME